MNKYKKAGAILILIGIAYLVFASGVSTPAHATVTPAASTAANSSSTEPVNQDNSHDLIYSIYGYYYLFYVDNGYINYVSSPNAITWSAPDSFLSVDGVNEGQAFSAYYNRASNTVYWVVGGGLTSFVVASDQPSSAGGFQLGSWNSNTYSDGLGYAVNQPSITFDSLGNTIIAYEGIVPGTSVNVVVDKITTGTTTLTNLFNWSSGQKTDDWDGKVYPYGSGGAFVLMYSSLHSGGAASPVPAYIEDYTGSSWLTAIELTTYQEATHGNGFTIGNVFYYYGQAEVGSEGVFFTHTLGVTAPPIQTVVFPNSLGIDDGYGTLSWDGQNTIVAYYDSGVTSPYTVWVSVSKNLGSSWTSPVVLATSSVEFEPETLGTNLVIQSGVSDVYWAVPTSSGSSIQVYGFDIALIAPTISVTPTTIDSGQSAMLSTITSFGGGTSPYICQWLAEAPGGSYVNLDTSFSCSVGGSPTVSTGTLSTVGTWSFELQVRDSTGVSATSSAIMITVNTALIAPADSSSSGTIGQGQSSRLTSTAVSTGTSPYTYQWYEEAPGGSFTQIAGATSPSYLFSTTGSTATGTWSFELEVADASGSAVTSSAVTVSVDSALAADAITPSSPAIDSGQSIILTANPSGGTTPYSYQWHSGSSATCSSDTTALGTASTQSVSPASLTYYCYQVTDSAPTPVSMKSATDPVMVNSALGAPFLSPSLPAIDDGQSLTIAVSWSGGTSTYTAKLYSGISLTCSSDTTLVSTTPGVSGTSTTFLESPTSNTYYCATVRDSAATPSTTTSSADLVKVNLALSAGAITPSSPVIDIGASVTITANPSGGTPAYTYQWYTGASCTTIISGQTGATYLASPTSTTTYYYGITDSAYSPVSQCSLGDTVTVNSALVAGAITPSDPIIDSGQSITLTAHASGGPSPYSYKWYSGTSATCSSDTTLLSSTTSTQSVNPTVNTYSCYSVTDSVSSPFSKSSATDLVTVHSALTAGAITPSAPTIVIGKSTTLTAQPSGGTSPYSYQWYYGSSATCSSDTTALGTASTQSVNPTTNTYYCYKVSDSSTGTPAAGAASATVQVAVNKATTTTKLTCTSPATVRTPSTCTVTVTGAYGSTNGETVSFKASGSGTFSSGGACILSGGTCSLTYTPMRMSGPPQTITTTYSGDTNNAGSSGKASIRVT